MALNEDHGLTAEEEAALNFKDDEETVYVDPDATAEAAAAEPAPVDAEIPAVPAADPVAAAGDPNANPAPATNTEPAPAPAPAAEPAPAPAKQEAAPAPLLIVQAPEDAQAQLAKIVTDKGALADRWEAGEITGKEYQVQLDALNEQQFDIKSQVREAELAQKLEGQRIQNQWVADCNSFLASHPEYADTTSERHKLLNETIMAIARMPSNAGLSNDKALAKAHRMVQVELGETPTVAAPAAAAKVVQHVVPKPAAPPNIGALPAAAMNDTSGGEFAAIETLRKSGNVDAYEDAVSKMTEAQRARYMRD